MVKGGRTFLRRSIDSMSSVQNRNDKVLLSPEFNADISRWINFMQVFNIPSCTSAGSVLQMCKVS
jgi:hypothetical protein